MPKSGPSSQLACLQQRRRQAHQPLESCLLGLVYSSTSLNLISTCQLSTEISPSPLPVNLPLSEALLAMNVANTLSTSACSEPPRDLQLPGPATRSNPFSGIPGIAALSYTELLQAPFPDDTRNPGVPSQLTKRNEASPKGRQSLNLRIS